MPPGIVEESGRTEEVRHGDRPLDALRVETPMPQEDRRAVAGEHVGQGRRGQWRFRELFARLGTQPAEHHSAVELGGAAGHGMHDAIHHQHAAVKRPGRLQLAVGDDPPILGRGTEPPGQAAVGGAKTIYPTVGTADDRRALVDRRRRIDPPAGGETPEQVALVGIKCTNRVSVDQAVRMGSSAVGG